jgi:hypothetical protein
MEPTILYISEKKMQPLPEGCEIYRYHRFPVGNNVECQVHKILVYPDKFTIVFRTGPYMTSDGFDIKARYLEDTHPLVRHMYWIKFLFENGVSLDSLPDFIYTAADRTALKDKEYLLKLCTLLGNFFKDRIVILSTWMDLSVIPNKVKIQGEISTKR